MPMARTAIARCAATGAPQQVIFARRPGFAPATTEVFEVVPQGDDVLTKPLKDGDVRCKTTFLSVDPYLRCRMDEARTVDYTGGYRLGEVLNSSGVGEVVESRHPAYTPGMHVFTHEWPWRHIVDLKGSPPRPVPAWIKPVLPFLLNQLVEPTPALRPLMAHVAPMLTAASLDPLKYDPTHFSPSLVLSVLGMPGFTAYTGMLLCGDPPPGSTVLVSGAAGAVGMIAGQLAARHPSRRDVRVVGIAGGQAKCDLLVNKLGFAAAVDYKAAFAEGGAECLSERIAAACGGPVDVYFDNVGGAMSDTIIQRNMATHSKVVICGQIANYENANSQTYPDPLTDEAAARVAALHIDRRRFNILHYFSDWERATADLQSLLAAGVVTMPETTVRGLENAGQAFVDMMGGRNVGKMVVAV